MAGFEEKLRKSYEYDPIEPRDGFLEELKALESAQKPRRRYLLPIAAAAALALIVGWAWLRAAPPERTPAPGAAQEELVSSPAVREEPVPEETEKPEKDPRTEPKAETPEAPEEIPPQETGGSAKTGPDYRTESGAADQTGANQGAQAPTAPRNDAPQADPAADEPENPAPDRPADPAPDVPDEPGPDEPADLAPDQPGPDEPADPAPEPPDEPAGPNAEPPADDPEPPRDPPIGAVYQLSDGRETLTLTLMSTGESVDLDVTGWEEQPEPAPDVPPGNAVYSGSNPIVNFLFEKTVTYYLTRDDDGTVRVDLDVADTDDGATEKGE